MDKIIERGLLFDFYGELLTPHQQEIYSEIIFNDLSLGEMSEQEGISRQGVHDLVRRCDKLLLEYEEKLGLIAKFKKIKGEVGEVNKVLADENISEEGKAKIEASLKAIVEEL